MRRNELELSTPDRIDLSGKRLLIFIVAYNAETTIEKVLSRIPASLHSDDVEVLIIDDSSKDGTFVKGLRYQQLNSEFKITVLRTPENQGYGGNQKLGYRYALDNGFDIVALIHGDGQYAPERLPELIEPLLRGEADAIFGSRMLDKRAALRGGMPLYKWIGNQILTAFQNRMLGTALSEFHSGYRLYATSALTQIPFEKNTNDFRPSLLRPKVRCRSASNDAQRQARVSFLSNICRERVRAGQIRPSTWNRSSQRGRGTEAKVMSRHGD